MGRSLTWVATGMGLAGMVAVPPAQALDLNGDGMSDVWQRLYEAERLAPESDDDGDGLMDGYEVARGSDPTTRDASERRRTAASSSPSPLGLVIYTPIGLTP